MQDEQFAAAVLSWFDQHGRKTLPWQQQKTPYHTWISEIMLQQTQVTTVIPYFERFIERFPDVATLATADIDEVLHLWTGLGYYARARNLHNAARTVMSQFNGQFPTDPQQLETLSGIGRSTAGAIASISAGIRAPILDGNVKRVLTRFLGIRGWPGETRITHQLWEWAERFTPSDRVGDYTQAMMDLGATLCTRARPQCTRCPLAEECQALKLELTSQIPAPRPKKVKPVKQTMMLMIRDGNRFLLQQRPASGIWGGLWSFPETQDLRDTPDGMQIDPNSCQVLAPMRHTFSHYHLDITPVVIDRPGVTWPSLMEAQPTLWYNTSQPNEIGLAAPVKLLLEKLSAPQLGEQL